VTALLTPDGPVPVPRQNPGDCASPPIFRAGRTYLVGAAVYDDQYYNNPVPGGPLTLRVGNVTTPRAPSLMTGAVSPTKSSASLSWSPPADSGTTAITGYRVIQQRRTDAGTWKPEGGAKLSAVAHTWTSKRLSPCHTYRFRLSAVNARGTGPSVDLITWGGH